MIHYKDLYQQMLTVHKIKYMEIIYYIFKIQKLTRMKTYNVQKVIMIMNHKVQYKFNYHIQIELYLNLEKLDIFH